MPSEKVMEQLKRHDPAATTASRPTVNVHAKGLAANLRTRFTLKTYSRLAKLRYNHTRVGSRLFS